MLFKKSQDKKKGGYKLTVLSNLMAQMTAKVQRDLFHLSFKGHSGTKMVIGFDYVLSGGHYLLGFTASYTQYATKYFSRTVLQDKESQILNDDKDDGVNKKDLQERVITEKRTEILQGLV